MSSSLNTFTIRISRCIQHPCLVRVFKRSFFSTERRYVCSIEEREVLSIWTKTFCLEVNLDRTHVRYNRNIDNLVTDQFTNRRFTCDTIHGIRSCGCCYNFCGTLIRILGLNCFRCFIGRCIGCSYTITSFGSNHVPHISCDFINSPSICEEIWDGTTTNSSADMPVSSINEVDAIVCSNPIDASDE